ncbi:MAG: hypothetical protein MZV63_48090 [Marinilabiliales bacterium]|nr:hypothetical protein [Marinilabiliales bacterium]
MRLMPEYWINDNEEEGKNLNEEKLLGQEPSEGWHNLQMELQQDQLRR